MNQELLKYTLMVNLHTPGSTEMCEAGLVPSTASQDNNVIIFLSTKEERRNKVFEKIFMQFKENVDNYPNLVEGFYTETKQYFSKSLDRISDLQPDNLIFSFTNSNSLYFRVYKGNYRAHIEVFYDYNNEEEDVEFVATVYSLNKEIAHIANNFNKGFAAVKEVLSDSTFFLTSNSNAEQEYA